MYSGISFSDQRTSMHKKSASTVTFTPTAASTAVVNDARPVGLLQRNHSLCQYLSVYLSNHISICLSIYLSIYLYNYLSRSGCLSIYLSIYLSMIYLSIHLYINLFIHAIGYDACGPCSLSINKCNRAISIDNTNRNALCKQSFHHDLNNRHL